MRDECYAGFVFGKQLKMAAPILHRFVNSREPLHGQNQLKLLQVMAEQTRRTCQP